MQRRRLLLSGLPAVSPVAFSQPPLAADALLPRAKLLLGAPPGGSGDLMARRMADELRKTYAHSVIVENRPGAGGQLAVAAMKDAPDDGSVLLLTPSSLLSIYPFTYRSLPYKPETDLTPLALVAWSAMALGVGPAVPATVRTLADFLAWARAHPQQASYGSPASGSIPHLLMAALAQAQGLPLTHVAYRGSTQALQDLRGGVLPALSGPLGAMLPLLRDGGLRLLAVSGERRSSFAPQVPTYREQGHELTAREWYGYFAPGKVRPDMALRASAALRAAMAPPEMLQALVPLGLEPAHGGPVELAALMRADAQSWRKLITKLGFTAES